MTDNSNRRLSPEEAEPTDNIIDLGPFLRAAATRQEGRFVGQSEVAGPAQSATGPVSIDQHLKSMVEDAAELPISEKLAALLAQLGVDQDAPKKLPNEGGDA